MRSPNAEKPAPAVAENGLQETGHAGEREHLLDATTEDKTQATSEWRRIYKVHPAADVFPMMSDDELADLCKNIKTNGLRSKVTFFVERPEWGAIVLADGRNRMEALERAGIEPTDEHAEFIPGLTPEQQTAYIISKNIHRRHLTKQQQADLIVAAIKAREKLDQVEPVSEGIELLHPCGAPTGLRFKGAAEEFEALYDKDRRKGGRGRKNPVKEKAVAEAKKHGISEATVKRSIAEAEGRKPLPQPKRYAARPLPSPRSGKPVIGLEAARRHYLDLCADPDVDLDAEMDIIVDALREIAGKRTIAASNSQKRASTLPQDSRSDGAVDDPTCGKNGGVR
jgi:hypothetical protein